MPLEISPPVPRLGFIGLGEMGGPMAGNLLRAGYDVRGFDVNLERLAECAAAGVVEAADAVEVVQTSDVVLTSLPSSAMFVQVAEESLLPHACAGQLFVDLGTVTPPETRRLASLFAERGAALVDAPVSGGPDGAERGDLAIFVGGDPEAVERARPVLEALGDPQRITFCGHNGAGQVVMGVNELAIGLAAAAHLEAVAFGVQAGVDAATLKAAIGGTEPWRAQFAAVARQVAAGEGDHVSVKFRELPYFLREAADQAFPLPLTKALFEFCDRGARVVTDDDHHRAPSFWRELTQGRDAAGKRPARG
jgi:3-hydroxyisobutyrate dehydrogenase-like beta-hydroxyacid dehydrogenase